MDKEAYQKIKELITTYMLGNAGETQSRSAWDQLPRNILKSLKELNYYQIEPDAELPERVQWATIDNIEVKGASSIYKVAQQDMFKANWRKVKDG